MKTNTVYTTVEVVRFQKGHVLSDQIISVLLCASIASAGSVSAHRVLECGQGRNPVFFTNLLHLQPRRWPRSIRTAGKSNCFQSTETDSKSEVVPRHKRQCGQDTDMTAYRMLILKYLQRNPASGGRFPIWPLLLRQQLFISETCGHAQHSSGRTASRKTLANSCRCR